MTAVGAQGSASLPRSRSRARTALAAAAKSPTTLCTVIVTHNSALDLPPLLDSLAAQDQTSIRLGIVVIDNASTDGSLAVAAARPGVTALEAGGNLGYAGAINAALRTAPPVDAVLILNPDLVLMPGTVASLVSAMHSTGAAVVVPQIRDRHGKIYPSLRREPTVLTALGDALFGSRLRRRPAWVSETVWSAEAYEEPRAVDWATGAAVMVRREVFDAVGEWDEQFFLYSEETDFMRRVRDVGGLVWYEPSACVTHRQGGSGSSPDLDVLLTVNRVRYARKHQSAGRAAFFRASVILGEALRAYRPVHRSALTTLVKESSWWRLPQASRAVPRAGLTGSVVIPAHDEASVLGTTLDAIAPLTAAGMEVIVVANGCSDDTAARARSAPGVRVLELIAPGKTAALNAADAVATSWPRLYLDADITITPHAVLDVFSRLEAGYLAARPSYVWDSQGADPLVRSYYRARSRIPSLGHSLWGAGAYALSEVGHRRIAPLPDVVADDVFVDRCFTADEKAVAATTPAIVRTPRTTRALLQVLRRQARGPAELGVNTSRSTVHELIRTVSGPLTLLDALVYAGLTVTARVGPATDRGAWERDTSTRVSR